jgi:hypothetical protein
VGANSRHPGITDDEANARRMARFIPRELPNVERYDPLAFNNVRVAKCRRLDRELALAGQDLVPEAAMIRPAEAVRGEGVEFVHWSGMTRRDSQPKA